MKDPTCTQTLAIIHSSAEGYILFGNGLGHTSDTRLCERIVNFAMSVCLMLALS